MQLKFESMAAGSGPGCGLGAADRLGLQFKAAQI